MCETRILGLVLYLYILLNAFPPSAFTNYPRIVPSIFRCFTSIEYSQLISLSSISYCHPNISHSTIYIISRRLKGKLCHCFQQISGLRERKSLCDLAFAYLSIIVTSFFLPTALLCIHQLSQTYLQFPESVHDLSCFSLAFSMKLHLTISICNKCPIRFSSLLKSVMIILRLG